MFSSLVLLVKEIVNIFDKTFEITFKSKRVTGRETGLGREYSNYMYVRYEGQLTKTTTLEIVQVLRQFVLSNIDTLQIKRLKRFSFFLPFSPKKWITYIQGNIRNIGIREPLLYY